MTTGHTFSSKVRPLPVVGVAGSERLLQTLLESLLWSPSLTMASGKFAEHDDLWEAMVFHDGLLRTREKCRKHEPQASVFYISRVFSNDQSVSSRLRLLPLLYWISRAQKTRFFYVLYSDKTWVFDQSERAQGPIYILMKYKVFAMSCRHDTFLRKKILQRNVERKKISFRAFRSGKNILPASSEHKRIFDKWQ